MLRTGLSTTVTTTVDTTNSAIAVGSGDLPVFATPMMIALMEAAACACVAEHLEPGHTTVGTSIAVDHTAPSPMDAEIVASAVVTGITGRKIAFDVQASCNGKQIGRGTHSRYIVHAEQFMESANAARHG